MSDDRRFPAWSRLTPAHAAIGAVVLVVAGLLASFQQDRTFRGQRLRELRVQGEILAASVTAALVFDDTKTVQEHVTALAVNPEIAAAGVYAANGRLVAWYARRGSARPQAIANDLSATPQDDRVVVPVIHEHERLGIVRIRPMAEPLLRRVARHVPMMLLAVMAALLVVFMGAAQYNLREANAELEERALALVETNARLENEMDERTKAEEALRQSQKMEAIGRMAGGVAHDFNNLLTIIQGNLHLLRRSGVDEPGSALLGAADGAAERAGNLVRRLLAFARRQPFEPQRVALSELAAGMRDLIVHSVGDEVRVHWALHAKWETWCDVNQMESVILNLVINARDAMPQGGTLTIATEDVDAEDDAAGDGGQYVQLSIADTGTGMSGEVRRRAVDPFFTTKPQGKGTGLGLSTAVAFVRQSNGQVNIDSTVGEGTTIVILLPRHQHDVPPPEAV